jgi:class 3 adenylate cyclase
MAGMSSLPRGTVTFVFTDIEESTALLRTLGDGYGEVLSAHRAIVREAFGAEGVEIDTQGDAFFFAFPRARDAVAAAVTVQREHAAREWPEGARVRVRIGLHTGEPAVHEEGYLGLDVVRAARICTAAPGGHVLLSETTRALLGSSLPEGVSVYPLGERHLKGIDEPERIYELEIDGVETEAAVPVAAEPSPPAPAAPQKPGEDFGERLAASIQEQVAQRLERAFEKLGSLPSRAGPDDDDVDSIAARSASLEESIRARVDAALKARGLDEKT